MINKIIGITGYAGSGKDTLYSYLQLLLSESGQKCQRVSLADELKKEVDPFLIKAFGISVFSCTREEKEIVRPILVEVARVRRNLSKGTYYTKLIESLIQDLQAQDIIPIITDIRFCEYENDEYQWLKNKNGVLISVTKTGTGPANEEESSKTTYVIKKADFKIEWPAMSSMEVIRGFMKDNYKKSLIKLLKHD